MVNSVTFPVELGGNGKTYTDDADPETGLDGVGYIERYVPTLGQTIAMAQAAANKAGAAQTSQQAAANSAQQASDDRDSIQLDLQQLDQRVQDADASAADADSSATTATNMADSVAQATATYTSESEGLANTPDTEYFRVIAVPTANKIAVYRNDAGSATPITTYYTKGGVDERNAQATRLARSLRRRGDEGQTLHADFAYDAYGLGSRMSGGVDTALSGEDLFTVERESPVRVWQPSGPNGEIVMTEVPPDTIARHWDPVTGQPLGMLIRKPWTNLIPWSEAAAGNWPIRNNSADWAGTPVTMRGITLDKFIRGGGYSEQRPSSSSHATWQVFFFDGGEDTESPVVISGRINGDYQDRRDIVFDYSEKQFSINSETGIESWSVKDLGGGLYQVRLTIHDPDITNVDNVETAIFGNNKWLGGFVVKEGGAVEDYIKTESAEGTRAASNVGRGMGSELDPSQGTVVVVISDAVDGGHIFNIKRSSEGAYGPRFQCESVSDDEVSLAIVDDSGLSMRRSITISPAASRKVVGFSWGGDEVGKLACNGQLAQPHDGSLPTQLDELILGRNASASGDIYLNGNIELIEVLSNSLSAADLADLTGALSS